MFDNIKKELMKGATENERMAWMRVSRSHNIGPRTMLKFLDTYGKLSEVLESVAQLAKDNKSKVKLVSESDITKEMDEVKDFGGQIILPLDSNYPAMLIQIPDFPLMLTVKGDVSCLTIPSIAIVGSRSCSMASRKLAQSFAHTLVLHGFCVVSGLAAGIDTSAHKGAVNVEGGKTIAVLAGGIDNIYPKENALLYKAIEEKGLLLTEDRIGSAPTPHHFPKRNRIITGLSRGVLVVEASKNSGSLTTANFALEQGREVFAVPSHPSDPRSEGSNGLLKQGATLVENVDDIIDTLTFMGSLEKKIELNDSNTRFTSSTRHTVYELQELRDKILERLSIAPVSLDDLITDLECDSSLFQQALVELELAGIVNRTEVLTHICLQNAA